MFGRTLNVPPVKGAVKKYCWRPATSLNTESGTDFCETFKGELRPKLHPCFYVRFFFWLYGERASHKVLWRFVWRKNVAQSFVTFWLGLTSYKVTKFCIQCKWRHTCECIKHVTPNYFAFFVTFMEKAPPIIKVYGVFDHFSRTFEVAKFWAIKLYFYVKDVIHANEQTK